MECRWYPEQKGALRHAVPCGHKNATVDGIKLSTTNLRGYIVITPLRLLADGIISHVCQALFLKIYCNYSRKSPQHLSTKQKRGGFLMTHFTSNTCTLKGEILTLSHKMLLFTGWGN